MLTLFQWNLDVPITPLNQSTCRRIAQRFRCYLLMHFKMNDKKKTSCFLICLCCISLQISFFSFLVSLLTFLFREKLQLKETFSHLIRKMIREFFSVKSDENCFSIVSCLCVFSSRRIWIFFANLYRTPQKNLKVTDCSLFIKTCFNFSVRHPRYLSNTA